jgi:hypothetical protein
MTPPGPTSDTLTLADVRDELRALRAEVAAQTALWPGWMSLEVAGRYTSLSTKSLRRLVARGDLQPRRVVRGKLLLSKAEIDSLMK